MQSQGDSCKTWKKITKPFKAVGNLLSGKLPKVDANVNVITPNYKGSFKTKIFGKMDFSDLLKFSVPTSVGFGSTAYGIFKAEKENYEILNYKFALEDVEDALIAKYKKQA